MHKHILNKVWEQKWDDCNTHSATLRNPCFHVTVHRGWSRHGEQGGHKYMYRCKNEVIGTHTQHHKGAPMIPHDYAKGSTWTDACTHSKQGLGTQMS